MDSRLSPDDFTDVFTEKFNSIKCMFFLHRVSFFEFQGVPNKLILRGLLNADVVGFHTFDYARHF